MPAGDAETKERGGEKRRERPGGARPGSCSLRAELWPGLPSAEACSTPPGGSCDGSSGLSLLSQSTVSTRSVDQDCDTHPLQLSVIAPPEPPLLVSLFPQDPSLGWPSLSQPIPTLKGLLAAALE